MNDMNEALYEVSQLLLHDDDRPVLHKELLNIEKLDYSVESVDEIQRYLQQVMNDDEFEYYYNLVVLRAGAYIGEVIKQNAPVDYHWYNNEQAVQLDPTIAEYGDDFGAVAVLHSDSKNRILFPFAKVMKCIDDGDDLRTYVEVMIER